MVLQHALRPYATAGVALVGASIVAVTPLAVPPPNVQARQVQLVDAWSELVTNTTANLDSIVSNADSSDISQVFSALLTNPLGVISALTNLDPTVTTTAGVPLTIGVELTPALEMGLALLGAGGAELTAINGVIAQLSSGPSNALNILYEGTAPVLNAGLNGADNVSLLGGIIDIPLFNGLLAPEQSLSVDLNLTDLLNALGLGNLDLSNLDLSSLLSQLGLGHLTLGGLVGDLNLGDEGLGTILSNAGITSLGGLSTLLGLDNLNLGLGDALNDAGLLTGILDTTAIKDALNLVSLGTLLGDDTTTSITSALNGAVPNLSTLLTELDLSNLPIDLSSLTGLLTPTLDALLGDLGLGNLADVTVTPFGGLLTELVDTVPAQILTAI